MSIHVIETHHLDGLEFGLSFTCCNPEAEDYYQMPNSETAYRLQQRLLTEFAPIPGNKPISRPCDEL